MVTNTLFKLNWQNSYPITGDKAHKILQLKKQEGTLIQVHGSCELIQTQLQNNLTDEFRLWPFSALIGSCKRLIAKKVDSKKIWLIKSETTVNIAIMTIYNRVLSDD